MPRGTKQVVLGLIVILVLSLDVIAVYRGLVKTRGTNFDFYLVWVGANEFWRGGNPYTDQIARQIQIGVLGHPAAPTENQHYFVYPAYLPLLIFPFPLLPFVWSVTGWLVLQQILLVIALGLIVRALAWKPTVRDVLVVGLVWSIFRYTLITLVLGQTSVMVLCLFAAAALASSRGREEWAAIALAAATIKPQLAFLPILGWLANMAARRQWRAVIVFGIVLLGLLILPSLVLGNWLADWTRTMTLYTGYNHADSPLTLVAFLLPSHLALALVVAGAAIGVSYLVWTAWHTKNPTTVLSLSILLTLVLIPLSSVYDIFLALLPWLVCWHTFTGHRDWSARGLLVLLGAMPVLSWAIITVMPEICDRLDLPFDAVVADKVLIPVLLLAVFLYAQRKTWRLLEQRGA